MVFTTFLITLILLIWFKTDAFIVYTKLLRIHKFFYINEWEEFKNTKDCTTTYHQFLRIKSPDGFWTKLITCPICFSVWLSIVYCIFIDIVVGIPIVCVCSLFIYFLITKLM